MKLENGVFEGERALFASNDLRVFNSVFQNGESPLKESRNLFLKNCSFKWKYPLWYCDLVDVMECVLDETARSGIWYTSHINIKNSVINAPKTFRRSSFINLENVKLNYGLETMWNCNNIVLNDVYIKGDYFGFGSNNIEATNIEIDGNYCFDGCSDIVIRNSKLISKDAFWNTKNVVVYDSLIVGEYLGWNSSNVTFINCEIESEQGLCYMQNVKLVNCKLINTTLSFEYSTVDAEVVSIINSVKNPISGVIKAKGIEELILEDEYVDTTKTQIILGDGNDE